MLSTLGSVAKQGGKLMIFNVAEGVTPFYRSHSTYIAELDGNCWRIHGNANYYHEISFGTYRTTLQGYKTLFIEGMQEYNLNGYLQCRIDEVGNEYVVVKALRFLPLNTRHILTVDISELDRTKKHYLKLIGQNSEMYTPFRIYRMWVE